jgi:cytochrome bd ubiquinol oxidase subunit II
MVTLALVYDRRYELARYCGAIAVAAIVAGWALARWPTILPGLTVDQAAAGHDTLVWVVVCVLAGAVILFPSLAFLFRLALAGRFQAAESTVPDEIAQPVRAARPGLIGRLALALLIAGFGLLNIANAQWTHAVGIVCLVCFVVLGFLAVVFSALGGLTDPEPARGRT